MKWILQSKFIFNNFEIFLKLFCIVLWFKSLIGGWFEMGFGRLYYIIYYIKWNPLCRFAASPPVGEKNCFRSWNFSPHRGEWPKAEGGLLKSRNSLSWFCLNGLKPHRLFAASPLEGEEIPIAQQIFSPLGGSGRRLAGEWVYNKKGRSVTERPFD